MKKAFLLLATCAFTTVAFAQTPRTEVKVRENGSKKIITEKAGDKAVTKTGKTNVGAALDNTADAAGNVAKKTGQKISSAFKKGRKKTKSTSYKASSKLRKATQKMEQKTE